jgi:hypothetical protein
MVSQTQAPEPEKKSAFSTFLWWKVSEAELEKQIDGYSTLGVRQSARGASLCLCLLSVTITVLFGRMLGFSAGIVGFEVVLWLSLGFSMYGGQRWAFGLAMAFWTLEKGLALFGATGGAPVVQLIWWAIYMKAFYLGYQVETRRREGFVAAA